MTPARIRTATKADLDALERLENLAFTQDRLSRRSLRRLLGGRTSSCLLAWLRDRLAGYALVLFRTGTEIARLYSLAVDPGLGRRGIGRRLLAACEAEAIGRGCTALRLEVRPDNGPAIALYSSCGYESFGRLESFYADGSDALRFEKLLRRCTPPAASRMPHF